MNHSKARPAPEWLENGIIYQINLRAFTPEGTLNAAKTKLEHVRSCGATIVYLMPVYKSDGDMDRKYWSERQKTSGTENPRNPYRAADYFRIDSEYGTENDLREFVAEAHSLGLRVMLDLAYYHCGPGALFLKEHPDWVRRNPDGSFYTGQWSFPVLNFENAGLREHLWSNMEFFVREFDVDGYRIDVSGNVILSFWEEARHRLERLRPDIGMLSEGTKPEDQLSAFDVNYLTFTTVDSLFSEEENSAASFVRQRLIYNSSQPLGARYIRFIDNHDIANDDFENRAEARYSFERANAALVYCMTIDGIPFLYCGQEIADRRRHSIIGKYPLGIHWEDAETEQARARMKLLSLASSLRRSSPAFSRGRTLWLFSGNPGVLAFERRWKEEAFLILINTSWKSEEAVIPADLRRLVPLMQNGETAENNTCTLPAGGYLLFREI